MHALEFLFAKAFSFERPINGNHFATAADHADVARVGANGPGKDAHVVFMAARDNQEISRRGGANFFKGIVKASVDGRRHWEALRVGECFAVVYDSDGKAGQVRNVCRGCSYVTSAEDIEHRLGKNRLDKDFQRAAADEAGIVSRVVIQVERHFAWLFAADDFFGRGPDVCLDTAAAD